MRTMPLALAVAASACIPRYDATRVTLRDPTATVTIGDRPAPVARELTLPGRPDEALHSDGTRLHMRYDTRTRIDTERANVESVESVRLAPHGGRIPLGFVVAGMLIGYGGGSFAYEEAEHQPIQWSQDTLFLTAGLLLVAEELSTRLAHDTVTPVTSW